MLKIRIESQDLAFVFFNKFKFVELCNRTVIIIPLISEPKITIYLASCLPFAPYFAKDQHNWKKIMTGKLSATDWDHSILSTEFEMRNLVFGSVNISINFLILNASVACINVVNKWQQHIKIWWTYADIEK